MYTTTPPFRFGRVLVDFRLQNSGETNQRIDISTYPTTNQGMAPFDGLEEKKRFIFSYFNKVSSRQRYR